MLEARFSQGLSTVMLAGLALACIAVACKASLTAGDDAALHRVRAKYGGSFKIDPEYPFYLRVQLRARGANDTDRHLEEIFRMFFLSEEGPRADSSLVYLDYYNEKGEFQYQLYFDRSTQRIGKQRVRAEP